MELGRNGDKGQANTEKEKKNFQGKRYSQTVTLSVRGKREGRGFEGNSGKHSVPEELRKGRETLSIGYRDKDGLRPQVATGRIQRQTDLKHIKLGMMERRLGTR